MSGWASGASSSKTLRLRLAANAWLDVVRGNPLEIGYPDGYHQLAALADTCKEKYMLYGEKTSTHYSRHYLLDEKWAGLIEQRLGSTKQALHLPPREPVASKRSAASQPQPEIASAESWAGWQIVRKFEKYLNKQYPAGGGPMESRPHQGVAEERNLAIVKHYQTGADCMGEHNDARSKRNTPVCSLSAGATRKIVLRMAKVKQTGGESKGRPAGGKKNVVKLIRPVFPRKVQAVVRKMADGWAICNSLHENSAPPKLSPNGTSITFSLAHGDVFVMGGTEFQTQFTHELPAEKNVREGRVGLVLRAREEQIEEHGGPAVKKRPAAEGGERGVRHRKKAKRKSFV